MTLLLARTANHWDNWLTFRLSRVSCRLFRRHTLHVRDGKVIDSERWVS